MTKRLVMIVVRECPMKRLALTAVATATVALLGVVTPVQATPFTYSEPGSGELGATLPAPSVFAFDIGVNTVSGRTTDTFIPPTVSVDLDSFAFSVPAGATLTDAVFSFTTLTSGGGSVSGGSAEFILDNGNAVQSLPYLGIQTVDIFGASPITMFNAALPLAAGTYGLTEPNALVITFSEPFEGAWQMAYTWSFTVAPTTSAPVPEPATFLLLGTGLVAVASRFRRRRSMPYASQ